MDPDLPEPLDPDVVPPEIAHIVERLPDGRLRFPREVQTPWRAGLGALVGVVPAVGGVLVLLLGLCAGSGEMLGASLVFLGVAPVVSLFAWVVLRTAVRPVVAGDDGIEEGPAWGPALSVRLTGDARWGSARLALVRPSGVEVPILVWWGLRHHRERGWDHDSVRWFAERIATLAGVVLEDRLPDVEEFARHEARRDRLRKEPFFEAYEAEPILPEEQWDHDRLTVAVPGSSGVLVVIQGPTSHSASVPITVSRDHVRVASSFKPVDDVRAIAPWFGTVKHGKANYLRAGQVRAMLEGGGHWILATRLLGSTKPGVIVGAAQSLDRVLQEARGKASADRGAASDVPRALHALATGARSPEDG